MTEPPAPTLAAASEVASSQRNRPAPSARPSDRAAVQARPDGPASGAPENGDMATDGDQHAARVRKLFNDKAPRWSAKYEPGGRLTGRLNRMLTAVLRGAPAGGLVLDLGCGTGDLAGAMAASGLRVAGCDIAPVMLSEARSRSGADPRLGWALLAPGWRRLPFRSRSFDAVVAVSVLEYVEQPGRVLDECARVLRPGGLLLCTVPDMAHPARWAERLAALAAGPLQGVTAVQGWPRIGRYLTYLRLSRQRHALAWWRATAERTGLLTASGEEAPTKHTPLRLLTFQRATVAKGRS